MEKVHERYMKTQKHACSHVFSPFSAQVAPIIQGSTVVLLISTLVATCVSILVLTSLTSLLCSDLSAISRHFWIQLMMYRWRNSGGSSTALYGHVCSQAQIQWPCHNIASIG